MPCGSIGAPTVSIEKIENGDEGERLRDHLRTLTGRRVAALMAGRLAAGTASSESAGRRMALPLVDADGMGRAFPEVPQVTMQLAGISPSPAVMTDERGILVIFQAISGTRWSAWSGRPRWSSAGRLIHGVLAHRRAGARGHGSELVSLTIRIGEAMIGAAVSPIAALMAEIGAFRLVPGKVSTSSGTPRVDSSPASW